MSGIDASDLLHRIIRPALSSLALDGPDADALLLATAAQESGLGARLAQASGPALGVWQMEPATHDDIIGNFVASRLSLRRALGTFKAPGLKGAEQMAGNLYYACALARLQYARAPGALPKWNDADGQAAYWKAHYNTASGAGTIDEFLANRKSILGALP